MSDPALERRRATSRRPVLIGLAAVLLVALVLGLYLPGFDRGYDLEALLARPWTTGLVFDRPDEDASDPRDRERYTADYAEFRLYTAGGCIVLDLADLRLAIARLRHDVDVRAEGLIKVSTRLPAERAEVRGRATRFGPFSFRQDDAKDGSVALSFMIDPEGGGASERIGPDLIVADRGLTLRYETREGVERVTLPLGRGRNLVVVRPGGPVEQQLGGAELERLLEDQQAPR
ncbi:MAG: hypothetical protein R3F30_14990 [Planctomycetota bacterium]